MASKQSTTENELSCSICHEIFKDPVFLSCSHSFCRTCIQLSWQNNTSLRCPICRRRSSKTDPPSNLVLKNLCEVFLQEACLTDEDPKLLCSLHGERLKLYCKKDKHPMCVECLIKEHKNHKICSITEAATPHRITLTILLNTLEEKQKLFHKFNKIFNETKEYIKTQAQQTEKQIKRQFEELHQFLRNEEATRIVALSKELDQKSALMNAKMEEMTKEISSFSDRINAITELIGTDDISLLKNSVTTDTGSMPLDPRIVPGSLINVASHLSSLKYKVWEKMLGIVQYIPVTLDPNTADINLFISEDLTSVKETIYIQPFPDNPERINAFSGVLGSEGFSSGKHYWDVAVGNDNEWVVGVAKESINRKKYCIASPKEGFWSIGMSHGECKALTSPPTKLPNKKFHKIRVQLDCDEGKVTFLDLTNNTTLYTFKHKFNERVFPYFFINGNNALIILPVQQLSLKVRAPQD
ncbi:zinc-binding protein A33-like [Scleropages formosus]|uniref:zinc-binding protein A33-like n=1 Tax=Scleropages formosus TaxID=113540 RepID=UPI0010FA66D7|nr:zinc-binding protein A33-like [Scleropages formosus]